MQSLFWSDIEMTDRLYRILDTAFSAVIKRSMRVNGRPVIGFSAGSYLGSMRN
jgi:hypothetical protein